MSKTIKQIADELCVSKQAIWQRVKRSRELNGMLDEHSHIENGRIYVDESLEQCIKALYRPSCIDETSSRVDETGVNKGHDVDETSARVYETSVNTADSKLLDTLQQTVSMLQQQLLAKDKQIDELTAMLKASQDQQATLASALTAAQALHAGTIQDRLTEHAGSSEDLAEDNGSLADQGKASESPEKKLGLFARIFGKKRG